MEINKLQVAKYLKETYYLEEFFKRNSVFLDYFVEYEKNSYLDDYSKFFFLFKLREQFLDLYSDYIEFYKLNESSVFYLLFSTPDFSTGVNIFLYILNNENDSILYINLFLQIEMFRIIDRIIYSNPQLYNYLLGILTIEKLRKPLLLNDPNLLLISGFIIEPNDLYKIVKNDFALYKVSMDDDFLRKLDVYPLNMSLKNLDNNIYERIQRKYVKNYNSFYYKNDLDKISIKDYKINEFMEKNRLLFLFDWQNLPKYTVDSSFSICDEQIYFCINDGFDYNLGDKMFLGFDDCFSSTPFYLAETLGTKNEDIVKKNDLKKIENQQEQFVLSSVLREKMKIKCSNAAYKLIKEYINSNKEIQDKKIVDGLEKLFDFLTKPEIKEIPVIENVDLKKAKYLLSFFITMKDEVSIFDFKNIENLKYLILYVTGNIHSINNQQLRQVHRLPNFRIANEIKSKLRSVVSQEFLR